MEPCVLTPPLHPQALPYVALLIVMLFFIYAVIGMQVRAGGPNSKRGSGPRGGGHLWTLEGGLISTEAGPSTLPVSSGHHGVRCGTEEGRWAPYPWRLQDWLAGSHPGGALALRWTAGAT